MLSGGNIPMGYHQFGGQAEASLLCLWRDQHSCPGQLLPCAGRQHSPRHAPTICRLHKAPAEHEIIPCDLLAWQLY